MSRQTTSKVHQFKVTSVSFDDYGDIRRWCQDCLAGWSEAWPTMEYGYFGQFPFTSRLVVNVSIEEDRDATLFKLTWM